MLFRSGRALNDGDLPGLAAFGAVAGLNAQGFHAQFLVHRDHLRCRFMGILYPHFHSLSNRKRSVNNDCEIVTKGYKNFRICTDYATFITIKLLTKEETSRKIKLS